MEEESLIVINVSGIYPRPSLKTCSPEWRRRNEDLERPHWAENRRMLPDYPPDQKCLWVEGCHRGKWWMQLNHTDKLGATSPHQDPEVIIWGGRASCEVAASLWGPRDCWPACIQCQHPVYEVGVGINQSDDFYATVILMIMISLRINNLTYRTYFRANRPQQFSVLGRFRYLIQKWF